MTPFATGGALRYSTVRETGDKVEEIKVSLLNYVRPCKIQLRAVHPLENDDSIPVRANKKKGLKSKKEVREEVQEKATEALKEIAIKHGFTSGKW